MGINNLTIQILASIYLLQFSMGLVFEIVSPTLDELSILTNSSMDAISLIFSLRSTGYVLGSIMGGGLFHYFIPLSSLTCAVLINALTIGLVGFTLNLNLLYTLFTVNGISTGVIDVGTNVWILRLFSDQSGPYMMALYTSFSIGTVIAPLYAAPFLHESLTPGLTSKLYIPFMITGLITLIPLVYLVTIFLQQLRLQYCQRTFFARHTTKLEQEASSPKHKTINNRSNVQSLSGFGDKTIVMTAVLMIMFYSGMEIIFSEYMVPMLNRSKLGITVSSSTSIRSATNAAHTIGKGIFIGISAFIRPYRIILVDSLVVIFAAIMLLVYFNSSLIAIWVFSIILGLGSSSIYPSIYPFIETFVTVDYFKGSFFICASGLTSIIYPIFVGNYLETTPTLILYLKLLTIFLTVILAIVINVLGSQLILRRQKIPTVDESDSNQIDENAVL